MTGENRWIVVWTLDRSSGCRHLLGWNPYGQRRVPGDQVQGGVAQTSCVPDSEPHPREVMGRGMVGKGMGKGVGCSSNLLHSLAPHSFARLLVRLPATPLPYLRAHRTPA